MLGAEVGQEGESHIWPSVRPRITASQDSQSWGICHQSVTGTNHGQLLKNGVGSPAHRRGLKQVQQDGMCLWSAWEVIGRKPIISADSPEQGESIQRNYVIFNVAKQEGSPILKRSER